MMSGKLRFGICGLGFMGRTHLARLHRHRCAEVLAVCDCDPARRAGNWRDAVGNLDLPRVGSARRLLKGLAAYATPAELIADKNVDAVLIALPTPLHAEVAVAALQAGKHVLCEKPMALCVSDCDRMIAAARASSRTLMVAQCLRFWPQYDLIKRYLDEGRLGRPRFAVLRRLASPPTYSTEGWLLDGRQSGGALLDLHVHDVDFVQYLLGLPNTICAHGTRGPSGEIDHVVATYGYEGGRYAALEGGWVLAAPRPFEMSITVHGELGTLEWSSPAGPEVRHYTGKGVELLRSSGDAYQAEDDYFIDCVLSGSAPQRCLPTSSRTSIALAWLERRSIEACRPVRLSERLREAWGKNPGER